ncbi:hypothetical protein [Caballeronia sp. LZ001]|uniref:hypothetical protein n=1 Tax=Caballeronia sp. LZ001 TaxID=3038553 RepID=UPI00285A0746|nr:hypothetical protein [Caballeronia sp. LZ001]MDR5802177.1 hypothetical protein [Caballeronia sp. LZ001]
MTKEQKYALRMAIAAFQIADMRKYIPHIESILAETSDKQEAPYSAPFTTDVPHCCGDPENCNDPCGPFETSDKQEADDNEIACSSCGLTMREARIIVAHPIASADEEREIDRLRKIAWLIASIFAYGDFKAETYNERKLEKLLRENGTFFSSGKEYDAAIAANRASEEGGSHDYKRSDGVCIECGELSASTDTKEK